MIALLLDTDSNGETVDFNLQKHLFKKDRVIEEAAELIRIFQQIMDYGRVSSSGIE